jgi:hypothetical protein
MTTYAAILNLISSSGSTSLDLTDDGASLSLAQAQTLSALGVTFAADDTIAIADAADTIEALTASEIATLKTLGVSEVLANDRALALDIAQVNAFAAADIAASSEYETMSSTTSSETEVGGTADGQSGDTVTLADGSYIVVYLSNDATLYVRHFDADGNAIGNATQVSTSSEANQASVTALADGGYIIVWTDNTTLYAQRYDADGNAVDGATEVDPEISTSSGTYHFIVPQVTGLSDGGYIITSYSEAGLVAQRYDADGVAIGSAVTLASDAYKISDDYIYSEGTAFSRTVELSDGSVAIFYTKPDSDGYGVYGQIIGSSGAAVGEAFAVTSDSDGDEILAAVTQLSNGAFAVAWNTDRNSVYMRIYDSAGNAVTAAIAVSESSSNYEFNVNITALADGGFVIAWNWSSSGDYIYSQVFDASGNAVTAVSMVNTSTGSVMYSPTVVALKGGGYVIVWSTYDDDSTNWYDISGQLFDADGNKIGDEFAINVNEQSNQNYQKIVALDDGGFAITWYDLSVGKFYTRVYHNDTDIASLKGTASAISALTASDAADLVEMGISTITVSNGGDVTLTKAAAVALAAISGISFDGTASVTVSDTGSALAGISASDIAKLDAMGVTSVDASNNVLSLSVAQAQAYVSAGIMLAGGDVVTVALSTTELAGLSASTLLAFAGIGVDGLDLTGNAASLTLARIAEIRAAGFAFADSDVITIADSQMYVGELTASGIQDLADWGVTRIDLTEGMDSDPATLSLAQANAFLASGIVFSATSKVYISASVSDIVALDADDIAAFAALGVDKIVASGTLPISVAQFEAYLDNGVVIDAGIEDVQLVDSAAHLEALSVVMISHLSDFGIRLLNASDDSLALDMDQIYALRAVGVSIDSSDTLALSVSSATLASLESDDLDIAVTFGVDRIDASTMLDASLGTLARVQAAGLDFGTTFTARLSDTAANLLAASTTDIDAYIALGVDQIRLADTGSVIAGLTTANINSLDALGVTTIDVTDGTVSLSLAKATKFADLAMVFEGSDTVIVTASASTFADPDLLDLAGLQSIHVDKIDVTDNALTLSLDQAGIYQDAGIGFVAADAITVTMSLAEAGALSASAGAALLAAGVDTLQIDMTAAQVKALTVSQIAAFGTTGINQVDIDSNAVTLSSAQITAFHNAGIDFASDDVVSTHQAPTLVNDKASAKEGGTATVSVLANDTAHDGLTLDMTGAVVASGQGKVEVNDDGTLSVTYTGSDIDGSAKAEVTVTYTVSDGIETSSANLVVTFTAVTEDIIGTNAANKLTGGAAGEVIKGLGGNDVLNGAGGNDTISGGTGNDRLIGGTGADILNGGSGKDVFDFNATSELGKTIKTTDRITDFSHAQHDVLDFHTIDANSRRAGNQDFSFIGSAKFHDVAGELRFERHGTDAYVYGDTNGDGKADFALKLDDVSKLVSSDFLL